MTLEDKTKDVVEENDKIQQQQIRKGAGPELWFVIGWGAAGGCSDCDVVSVVLPDRMAATSRTCSSFQDVSFGWCSLMCTLSYVTMKLTVQQISDFIQVDFKVGNLPRRRVELREESAQLIILSRPTTLANRISKSGIPEVKNRWVSERITAGQPHVLCWSLPTILCRADALCTGHQFHQNKAYRSVFSLIFLSGLFDFLTDFFSNHDQ